MTKNVFVSFNYDNDKHYKFLLEAWNDSTGNMVLFQVLDHGRGFKAYTLDTNFIGQYELEI